MKKNLMLALLFFIQVSVGFSLIRFESSVLRQDFDLREACFADMDRDGDMDIIVANQGDRNVYILRNDVDVYTQIIIGSQLDEITGVAVGYISDDNLRDVVICSSGDLDDVKWYQNTGNCTFGAAQAIDYSFDGGDVMIADLNSDGYNDVVCSSYQGNRTVCYWPNNGDNTFGALYRFNENGTYGNIAIGLTGAERNIVVSGAVDNGIALWEAQDTPGLFENRRTIPSQNGRSRYVHSLDIGNDGDFDIVAAMTNADLVIFENDGSNTFTEITIDDYQTDSAIRSITTNDINGDGNFDIIVSTASGVDYLENIGDYNFISHYVASHNESCNSVDVFDNNSDGRNDIVYLRYDDTSYIMCAYNYVGCSISGVVKDLNDNFIENVEINLNDYQCNTNGSGEYFIENLPIGTFSITAIKNGYYNYGPLEIVLQEGENQHNIEMTPIVQLSGIIRDENGIPINQASVYLEDELRTTNNIGYYEFTSIIQGNYTLTVQKAGYNDYIETVYLYEQHTRDITLIEEEIVDDPYFEPVDDTGMPYAFIFRGITLDENNAQPGDEIGIFDGDLCVGAAVIDNFPLHVTVYQNVNHEDNPNNPLPGYIEGNIIAYKFYKRSIDQIFESVFEIAYNRGNERFGTDAYSDIELLSFNTFIDINVAIRRNYFELLSININIDDLFAPSIFGNIEHLEIVYQNNGDIYIPEQFNFIEEVNPSKGYRAFCSEVSEWTLQGTPLNPETEYYVQHDYWNWIGYPFYENISIATALSEIEDNVVIVLDDDGNVWVPSLELNTFDEGMKPNKGYFVMVNSDAIFCYNDTEVIPKPSNIWDIPDVIDGPVKTGLPYLVNVYVNDIDCSVIEIYDEDILVGKSIVVDNKEFTPVIVWKGSEKFNLPGYREGHNICVKLLNSSGNIITEKNEGKFGIGAFSEVNLNHTDINTVPTDFFVKSAYPNPFNPTTIIEFNIPNKGFVQVTAFNVLGEIVYANKGEYNAGNNNLIYDASKLSAGIYFIEMKYNQQISTQKVLFLK